MSDERAVRSAGKIANLFGVFVQSTTDAAADIIAAEYADVLAENERLKDELREARWLLSGCRPAMVFSDQQRINAFLDRTEHLEQESKHD